MPTPHRRRYMCDYMKEYRGNPARHDELKTAHRLDSFKWRLSKLLSSQYEILLCEEYGPFKTFAENEEHEEDRKQVPASTDFNQIDLSHIDGEEGKINFSMFLVFPIFHIFSACFHSGGREIFKVILLAKISGWGEHVKTT
jgi:hypothetical protein